MEPAQNVDLEKRQALFTEVRDLIIRAVNLHHLDPNTVKPETPLIGGGLNLDSVDILEVVVSIEQKYKVKVGDAEVGRKYFGNIDGIVDFLLSKRG